MRRLFKGGRLLDPAQGLDATGDVLVVDGRVAKIGTDLADSAAEVVPAAGLWLLPGLIDLHAHFRDPGETGQEDIASGRRAAAAGGYTAVCVMPNTKPVIDQAAWVTYVKQKAAGVGPRVYPIGAITKLSQGEELAEMGLMRAEGAVAFSDDGRGVARGGLMRLALLYARSLGAVIIAHEEDESLAGNGVMHLGSVSTRLGLPGIPAEAEEVMVARDLILAEATGARLHLAHLSSRRSVELVREAKARGVRVTAEVTPHHLLLTEAALTGYDPSAKVNPPLRSEADREALVAALADGTIDAIATDHAPHSPLHKEVGLGEAAFGAVGLETAVGVLLTHLVNPGLISPLRLAELLSTGPARVLNLPGGSLRPGVAADITLLDPELNWMVEPQRFFSKSQNSPFAGWELRGRAVGAYVDGEPILEPGGRR